MRRILKAVVVCICAATFIFSAVIGVSYIPRHVRQEFHGLELLMKGNDEFDVLRTVDIRVDGHMRNGLFANHPRFTGLIEISEYEFTSGVELDMFFYEDYTLMLMYAFAEFAGGAAIPVVEHLGTLHTDKNFSSLAIRLMEMETQRGSRSGTTGNRVIAAPAANVDSARDILRDFDIFWSD